MQPLRRALAGAAYEAKTIVARSSRIALPLQRARGRGEVIGPDTDLVIEGFPRCASSFVVAAFRLAQEPRAMRIANHTHMPAQVIEAVRRGLPALVLVREPEPTLVSHLIRNPDLPAASALRGYIRFHEPLMGYLAGVVVGVFEEVTTDLGAVIERLNARFGTSFRPFEHTAANLARIEREIEDDYRPRARSPEELERIIPRPSATRDALKERARERYLAAPSALRRRADAVYRVLAG
jgi:hypothetical protein